MSKICLIFLLLSVSYVLLSQQCEPNELSKSFYREIERTGPGLSTNQSCGQSLYFFDDHGAGITGGIPAVSHEFPWHVHIIFEATTHDWVCGGSIIDESTILTAAHCCQSSAEKGKIQMGWDGEYSYDLEYGFLNDQLFRHPEYSKSTQLNDFCIIKLKEKIHFKSDRKVLPICLPESCSESCAPGQFVIMAGWGSEDYNLDTLVKAVVPVWSSTECLAKYGKAKYIIDDSHVCAGLPDSGVLPCYGDSGSSLGCTKHGFFQIDAIASWGTIPCNSSRPAVFGRICKVLDWIKALQQ